MLNHWARFRSVRGRILWIAVASIITAQLEATVLVLLVPLATTVADGRTTYAGEVGPFDVELGVGALAILIVGAVLGALLLTSVQMWARARTVARWQNEARQRLVRDWMNADWEKQSSDRLGALPTLVSFVQRGGTILTRAADLLRNAFTLLIFLITAVAVSPLAAGVLSITGLVLLYILHPLVRRVRKGSRQLSRLTRQFNNELTELAGLGREVKVFGAAVPVAERMGRLGDTIESRRARQTFLGGVTQPLYQYLGLLLGVGAVLLVARGDDVGVETLGAVALLLIRSLAYGQAAQNAYQNIVESAPYLDTADQFRDELQARAEVDGDLPLETIDEVRFEGVVYRYDDTDPAALGGVDLVLRRGEIVGLVGPSGSGKSTLAQILLRLRRPTAGRLVVNGQDAADTTLRSWRRLVTLVPQDVPLTHASLYDNVAFFDPGIDRAQVAEAVTAVGLDAVVDSIEDGIDTQIGPSTRNLSGGQIQRIGIARALARRPQVLVLDEPTSALDVHSEAIIHDTVEALRGQMLVVIIAHRLSTLAICDRLVVLDKGRIEADGPLADVFDRSDYFRDPAAAGLIDDASAEADRPVPGPSV